MAFELSAHMRVRPGQTFYSEPVPELVELAKKHHMEDQFKCGFRS